MTSVHAIYLGWAYGEYDDHSGPDHGLVYSGTDFERAAGKVEDAVKRSAWWSDPEPEKTYKRSDGYAWTSEIVSVGSTAQLTDEITVPAHAGSLNVSDIGVLWEILPNGTIRRSRFECVDYSTREGRWAWETA